jgi:hypothetical protein
MPTIMPHYRVFLDAPTLQQESTLYHWQTASLSYSAPSSEVLVSPPATSEAASHRVSVYKNVIFGDDDNEGTTCDDIDVEVGQDTRYSNPFDLAVSPCLPSKSRVGPFDETMETQDESISYNYSDASSIARFPAFQFNPHSLTSLASLNNYSHRRTESRKVALLLAVLEVDGPDTIRIKKGVDAGKDVSILKMILGDESGQVCKLTAWREIADAWGGNIYNSPAVKRGDIVFIDRTSHTTLTSRREPNFPLTGVLASYQQSDSASITLTASPYQKPTLEICYRTLPYTREDGLLRPDLRLGVSDIAVRKVATVVNWFEKIAGLAA